MGIANYLKEIGRGKEGARSLSDVQAEDLMSQVLDRKVSEAERGAPGEAPRDHGRGQHGDHAREHQRVVSDHGRTGDHPLCTWMRKTSLRRR